MGNFNEVLAAAVAFVGSHFLLSHPLRKGLIGTIGERAFQGVYSLIAIVTFAWLIRAYAKAPVTEPLWPVGNVLWAIVTVLMLIASILLLGSLIRNPALPALGKPGVVPDVAHGVFSITRHPMMWAFALWGLCHIAVFPVTRAIILAAAMVILALVGAALQDRKKQLLDPDAWPAWESKTSYLPFAAIVSGRARLGGFRMHELLGGLVVWLVATWAHIPLSGWPAGIWRWLL
jgi:uncharacterized membrane protein